MTMTVEIHERQRFIKLCDPEPPLRPDDPLYVALDEGTPVRGGDGRSCIDVLEHTILFSGPTDPTCQLFTGFPGTGKTTELRRLCARLNDDKLTATHVILIDFQDFIDHYTPISITDILRILAYALDREATVAEGDDPDQKPGYLRRLFDMLARTEVELQNIGFAQFGSSLMLEFKNTPLFRQKAEAALALRFQQFAKEATDVMSEAIVRLRKATHAQRVVVIADSLEKLTPLREEDRGTMEASVETVFVQHASWLRLPCHTIYTFPLWLRFRAAALGSRYNCEPQILPMVKVTEPDGTPFSPGIVKLTELVGRRVDLRRVFTDAPEQTFFPLIAASGGYPRDLLRLVREVLYWARSFPVTAKDTEHVINQLGETYARTIRAPDLDILAEVAQTHEMPQGDDARIADFGRLLGRWLVLAYRNGSEWYDLHPLVRLALAKRPLVKPLPALPKP